jgi:Zn finger protein HypA/HybF involved in hydrogenase expression
MPMNDAIACMSSEEVRVECMKCKAFIKGNPLSARVSHGVCPTCMENYRSALRGEAVAPLRQRLDGINVILCDVSRP